MTVVRESSLLSLILILLSNGQGAGSLTQGRDGNLYGTTPEGGIDTGSGTVFRIAPTGQFTSLYEFCSLSQCADGWNPGSLVLGVNGNLYGTTGNGGTGNPNGCGPIGTCGGTFFQITPKGQLTTLYNFCSSSDPQCANGSNPAGRSPVLGYDGKYYGTAYMGGNTTCFGGCGTVYDVTTAGTLSTFYALQANALGEAGPDGLVLGSNGNFYGLSSTTENLPSPAWSFN